MPGFEPNSLQVLLEDAGFRAVTDRAFVRITGSDAPRWLNGMVSNSIQALEPGEGNYNFLLNAQGRIQGDATVYRETTAERAEFLLATSAGQVETIQKHLDHFIIMDDVELTPAYADEAGLLVAGKRAAEALGKVGVPAIDPLRLVHADTEHGPVLLLTPAAGQVPVFELRGATATIDGVQNALQIPEVSAESLEFLRLLDARPLFGQDIRNTEPCSVSACTKRSGSIAGSPAFPSASAASLPTTSSPVSSVYAGVSSTSSMMMKWSRCF